MAPRRLETENARLKKLLAEAELDTAMLKGPWWPWWIASGSPNAERVQ